MPLPSSASAIVRLVIFNGPSPTAPERIGSRAIVGLTASTSRKKPVWQPLRRLFRGFDEVLVHTTDVSHHSPAVESLNRRLPRSLPKRLPARRAAVHCPHP